MLTSYGSIGKKRNWREITPGEKGGDHLKRIDYAFSVVFIVKFCVSDITVCHRVTRYHTSALLTHKQPIRGDWIWGGGLFKNIFKKLGPQESWELEGKLKNNKVSSLWHKHGGNTPYSLSRKKENSILAARGVPLNSAQHLDLEANNQSSL